jgi:hypothetical protein
MDTAGSDVRFGPSVANFAEALNSELIAPAPAASNAVTVPLPRCALRRAREGARHDLV